MSLPPHETAKNREGIYGEVAKTGRAMVIENAKSGLQRHDDASGK